MTEELLDNVYDPFNENDSYHFTDKKLTFVVACLFLFAFVFLPAILMVIL